MDSSSFLFEPDNPQPSPDPLADKQLKIGKIQAILPSNGSEHWTKSSELCQNSGELGSNLPSNNRRFQDQYQKEKGEELDPALSTFLKEDKNYYKKVAEQHLNPYRDRQFLKKLKDL